jgi:hypothetical protein
LFIFIQFSQKPLSIFQKEAPPVGLEPTTDWLTASRSTELSYGGFSFMLHDLKFYCRI